MAALKKIGYLFPYLMLWSLGLGTFALLGARSYSDMRDVVRYNDWRQSAQQSLMLTEETMSLLKDLETGQRGFLITGEEAFLQPYRRMQSEFGKVYGQLYVRLSKDEVDRQLFEQLNDAIQACIRYAEMAVAARQRVGAEAINDRPMQHEGKRLMDAVRQQADLIRQRLSALERRSENQASKVNSAALANSVWLAVCGAVIVLLSAVFYLFERRQRNRVELALQALNASLGEQVAQRTLELNNAMTTLQSFAREMDHSIESERKRLAREVHDQLGQVFTALRLIFHGVNDRMPKVAQDEIARLLDEGVGTARRIASELRPTLLDDFGLAAALEFHADNVMRMGGPTIRLDVTDDKLLKSDEANQLFRICQEAITNVIRHAKASEVIVAGIDDGQTYFFSVADNGVGLGPIRQDATGIRNMRERAALIGAQFGFERNPGGGTRIVVTLPRTNATI